MLLLISISLLVTMLINHRCAGYYVVRVDLALGTAVAATTLPKATCEPCWVGRRGRT